MKIPIGPIVASLGTVTGIAVAAAYGAGPWAVTVGVSLASIVGFTAGRAGRSTSP